MVVPVPKPPPDTVLLGATVTLLDPHGVRAEHRIVGADETDLGPGWISWVSPLARALIGARVGQRVQIPSGELVACSKSWPSRSTTDRDGATARTRAFLRVQLVPTP